MTTYAKRKLKYSRSENVNLLHYVEWDRFVTLAGSKSGLRVTLSYRRLIGVFIFSVEVEGGLKIYFTFCIIFPHALTPSVNDRSI